jgi:hypothetical protein
MTKLTHSGKNWDFLIYIAMLVSMALTLCCLIFLLNMISHLFWGAGAGIPFFIKQFLRAAGIIFRETPKILVLFSFLFLLVGTLFFGYLSWTFSSQLSRYKKRPEQQISNHKHFHWKMLGIILIIVLIAAGYFVLRFYS